ncbi:MAG: flagellar motor switch phosphatase FliY [Oscillospiraceae bacterium]|nr:flagellar motor switch phosphatase FliY [Oscillospiraceae bacterium]
MADEIFTPMEIDTIGEIMNISMGSAATAASTLLDNKVTITTPVVQVATFEDFRIDQLEPAIAVEITYVEGISGSNILILRREDVRVILSMMMMTELPADFEVDEMAQSAICELMNQMMGSSATVLSCFLGRTINISTPEPVAIDEIDEFKTRHFGDNPEILTISFELEIADKMKTTFLCAMHIELAKEIIDISLNFGSEEEEEPVHEEVLPPPMPQAPPPMPEPQPMPQAPPITQEPYPQAPPMQEPMAPPMQQPYPQQPYPQQPYAPPYPQQQYPAPGYGYPMPQAPAAPIKVQDYNYNDFGGDGGFGKDAPTNLDLIMGVPVMVTVELGRTKRKIKEILEFGQGTIVELDKQAGSQVDVIVNGQLIARGDVVVVDDNFSIRITEILKSRDSLGIV